MGPFMARFCRSSGHPGTDVRIAVVGGTEGARQLPRRRPTSRAATPLNLGHPVPDRLGIGPLYGVAILDPATPARANRCINLIRTGAAQTESSVADGRFTELLAAVGMWMLTLAWIACATLPQPKFSAT